MNRRSFVNSIASACAAAMLPWKRVQALPAPKIKESYPDAIKGFVVRKNSAGYTANAARTRPAIQLPPIEENSEDWSKANALKNMEYLDAEHMRNAYRELTASFYCRERQLLEVLRQHEQA